MITYSALALGLWVIFFGIRFISHFPIAEFGFYVQWALLTVPHVAWLAFLGLALKYLRGSSNKVA